MTTKPAPPALTELPCRRCMELALLNQLRMEAVQRLPPKGWAPLAQDRSGPQCYDCASADTLVRLYGMTFQMARVAVANDRQEQYRLPGAPMGLVKLGLVRPSAPGDMEAQHAWLKKFRWFGTEPGAGP